MGRLGERFGLELLAAGLVVPILGVRAWHRGPRSTGWTGGMDLYGGEKHRHGSMLCLCGVARDLVCRDSDRNRRDRSPSFALGRCTAFAAQTRVLFEATASGQ